MDEHIQELLALAVLRVLEWDYDVEAGKLLLVDLLAQLDESEQDLVLQHPVLERVASAKMPLFIPSRRWMPLRRAIKARKRLLRRQGGSGITQGFKAP